MYQWHACSIRGRSRHAARRRGMTLVEVSVAVAVIGIGVTALVVAAGSSARVNDTSREITQATLLVQEAREWTLDLPFQDQDDGDMGNPPGPDGSDPQDFVDDLDDLIGEDGEGVTYSPPHDGQGYDIYLMSDWSQEFQLDWRDPADLDQSVSPGGSDVVYVTVTIRHSDKAVMTSGWLVTRGSDE